MQHKLLYNSVPVMDQLIEIDRSLYPLVSNLDINDEMKYNFLLYQTIGSFNYGVVDQRVDDATVLHEFGIDEKRIFQIKLVCKDHTNGLVIPMYLHILAPTDQLLKDPKITSVVTMDADDGKIQIIGMGKHHAENDTLFGNIKFECLGKTYEFNMEFLYYPEEKQWECKFIPVTEGFITESQYMLPYFFFDQAIDHLKKDEIEQVGALLDDYIEEPEVVLTSELDETQEVPFAVELDTEDTDLLYITSDGKDAADYGSLAESFTKLYYYNDHTGKFYSHSMPHVKVIRTKMAGVAGITELYLVTFVPLLKPDHNEESEALLVDSVKKMIDLDDDETQSYWVDEIEHRSRMFMKLDGQYYLVGAGEGNSVVDSHEGQQSYNGYGACRINGGEYVFNYTHDNIVFRSLGENSFVNVENFDVNVDYQNLASINSDAAEDELELKSLFEDPKTSLPLPISFPNQPELDLEYFEVDGMENPDKLKALIEYLSFSYGYYRMGKYYSPTWIQFKALDIETRLSPQPFSTYLALFHPFGEMENMPTPEEERALDEDVLAFRKSDQNVHHFHQSRLIIERDGEYFIVGRGFGDINIENKDYFGDGECMIDGTDYYFNYDADSFSFGEMLPTSDRTIDNIGKDISINYGKIEMNERSRKRHLE